MECTKAFGLPQPRYRPPNLSFRYGMNEIRYGLLARQCDSHESIIGNRAIGRLNCGKSTHIYKKRDFSLHNSMGKGRISRM